MPEADELRSGSKGEETRERILNAALQLFHERGFEATTMREVAQEAGVATGAAYYYFASKDAIVLAFYRRAAEEMAPQLEEALARGGELRKRLAGVLDVKLRYFAPSRRLLTALAAHVDPEHPLSPFSEATREIREKDVAVFERAISGSQQRIPKDLAAALPGLLWMYQMAVILYWIHDRSAEQKRTAQVVEKSLWIVGRLIQFSGLPLLRPLRRRVVELYGIAAG